MGKRTQGMQNSWDMEENNETNSVTVLKSAVTEEKVIPAQPPTQETRKTEHGTNYGIINGQKTEYHLTRELRHLQRKFPGLPKHINNKNLTAGGLICGIPQAPNSEVTLGCVCLVWLHTAE